MTTDAELCCALKYRVEVNPDTGARRYYNSANQLHSDVGPAVVWADGTRLWFHNGVLHRTDGPAVEYIDGTSLWYQNGLRHRVDGPAVVYPNSQKFWFIEDCAVSQEKFNEYVSRIAEEVSRNLAS